MLNDFVTGKLKTERAQRIIPKLKRLIDAARNNHIPVIFSNDAHYPQDPEVVNKWREHAIKGTKGAEVIPEFDLSEKDYVIEKRTYNGFYETGLDSLLRSLEVDSIIMGGLHTHICVRHTAAGAFFRGYKIIIAEDGIQAFTDEDHKQGVEYLKNVYNAEITSVAEIIKKFPKQDI